MRGVRSASSVVGAGLLLAAALALVSSSPSSAASAVLLSGRVVDGSGNGIANVNVSAYQGGASATCCTWVTAVSTDSLGAYSISLAPATYRIQFYPPTSSTFVGHWWSSSGTARLFSQATDIALAADQTLADVMLETGSVVSGRVTDASSSTPVQGVNVSAYTVGSCCSWVNGTATAADGTYSIRVPNGTYRLQFYPSSSTSYIAQWWSGGATASRYEEATDVLVSADVTGKNAALVQGRKITGTVTDNTSSPVAGIRVNAYVSSSICCNWQSFASTGADGRYTLIVTPGVYKLRFDGPPDRTYLTAWSGGATIFENAAAVDASAGDAVSDISLTPGVAITGHVTDGQGHGVGGVGVSAFAGGANATCCTFVTGTGTDPTGAYALIVPAGTYRLGFFPARDSGFVSQWYGGAGVAAVHFADALDVTPTASGTDVALASGSTLTGHVTRASDGAAISGAFVSAFKGGSAICCSWVAGTSTDTTGSYTLVVPANGTYRIQFSGGRGSSYTAVWYDGASGAAGFAGALDIAAGQTLNASLTTGRIISGTVTSNGTTGVANVGIGVFAGGTTASCCTWVAGTGTAPDGTYQIVVPSGKYRLSFWPPRDSSYRGQWYGGPAVAAQNFDRAIDIDTSAGNVTIDVTLATGWRISGRVTSDGTNGIAGVGVSAVTGGGAQCCSWIAGTGTDGNGSYTLVVPAGTYRLQFYPPPGSSYISQWWSADGGADRFEHAGDIAVSADVTGKNTRLATGVTIRGRLTDGGQAGIANVGVGAFIGGASATCCTWVSGTQTDKDGYYTLPVLPGAYRLQFWPPRGSTFQGAWWSSTGPVSQFDSATDISATSGASGIDLTLVTGLLISGRVTASDNPGVGIPGVGVSVVLGGSAPCCTWLTGTGTDQDGSYSIVVSPGTYKIQFFAPPGTGYLNRFWSVGADGAADFWTAGNVAAGDTGRNIALPRGVVLSGVVTSTGGAPLQGVGVNALACSGSTCRFASWAGTDKDGKYSLAVANGIAYRILFAAPFGQPYISQWYQGKATQDLADPVTPAGNATLTTVQLAAGAPITGRVTDANGVGIPGVGVGALTCSGFSCTNVGNGGTGPTGEFSIVAPAGSYKINVFPPPGSPFVGQWYDGQTGPDTATPVAAPSTTPIVIKLARGSRISGRITDGAGQPIPNVDVNANSCSASQCFWAGGTRTAENGTYSIVVANGTYKIFLHAPFGSSYISQWYNNNADVVVSGGDVLGIDATLALGQAITGHVTDGTSAAIANASVSAYTCTGFSCQWVASTQAGPDGAYTLVVATGTYKLRADPPFGSSFVGQWYGGADPATATGVASGGTANFVLQSGNKVNGRVITSGGAGIANANVSAQTCTVTGGQTQCSWAGGTHTNPDGTYMLLLVNGDYKIRIDPPFGSAYIAQWYNGTTGTADAGSATSVHVAGTVPLADVTLATGLVISGKVTDTGTAAVPNAFVAALSCPTTSCTWVAGTATNPDGTYSIVVPPGTYKVWFHAPSGTAFLDQWYDGTTAGATTSAAALDVTPPQAGVDAQLVSGFRVHGFVKDASGNALANANVSLWLASSCTTFCQTWVAGTSAGSDGSYSIAVPSGSYKVQFNGPFGQAQAYLTQWYSGQSTSSSASAVDVSADTTLADARLVPGFYIRGTVKDATTPTPAGIANAIALAATCAGGNCVFVAGAGTAADGTYSIIVPAGMYKIRFEPPSGSTYVRAWWTSTGTVGTAAQAEAIPVSANVSGKDAAPLPTGHYISGLVKIGSTGVGGARVTAMSAGCLTSPALCRSFSTQTADGTNGTTLGAYRLLVPDGTYRVRARPPQGSSAGQGWWTGSAAAADIAGATDIPVSGSDQTGKGLILPAGVAISGSVTNGSGGPVANVRVAAFSSCVNQVCFVAATALTGTDGTYTLSVHASAGYKLGFEPPAASGLVSVLYDGVHDADFGNGTTLAVGASSLAPINATLLSGSVVSGTVTDVNGNPVDGASVELLKCTTTCVSYSGGGTASDGTYAIAVPAGSYEVHVTAPGIGLAERYYNGATGAAAVGGATRVTVDGTTPKTGVDVPGMTP